MQEQIISKLASLETNVSTGFKHLDEKMSRFQTDLHKSQLDAAEKIADLDKEFTAKMEFKRAKIDTLVANGETVKSNIERRLIDIETWQKVVMARVGLIAGSATVVFTLLGPTIRQLFGISNG